MVFFSAALGTLLAVAASQLLLLSAVSAAPAAATYLNCTAGWDAQHVPISALDALAAEFKGEILTCSNKTQLCVPLNSSAHSSAPAINMILNLTYCKSAWNTYSFPQLVLRPANVDDIRAAIAFSNFYCLRMGVKSGGHGPNEGARVLQGVTLDLFLMDKVTANCVCQQWRLGTRAGCMRLLFFVFDMGTCMDIRGIPSDGYWHMVQGTGR